MALLRAGYELRFEPISPGNPAYGSVAGVPWDTEIFGFPVARYQPGYVRDDQLMAALLESLRSWLTLNRIALCSCAIPGSDTFWRRWLPQADFRFVDSTLQVTLNLLSMGRLPTTRLELRPAQPEDHAAVKSIAAHSFAHGRYHADPFFPKELANRRYRQWVETALSGEKPEDRVFVLGKPGQVLGFYHVTVEKDLSDLRLAAVAPNLKKTGVGVDLYVGVLAKLQKLGIKRVVSNISSGNTGVMNIYSMLGFRFSNPEAIYHWHSPDMETFI